MGFKLSSAIQGWALIGALLGLIGLHFTPLVINILEIQKSIYETRINASELIERVNRPLPPDQHAGFRSFTIEPLQAQSIDQISLRLQTELRDHIIKSGSSLKSISTQKSKYLKLKGYNAQSFRVDAEGDYLAVLSIFNEFAKLQTPFLIESLKLAPLRQGPDADRRMRISLEITALIKEGQS